MSITKRWLKQSVKSDPNVILWKVNMFDDISWKTFSFVMWQKNADTVEITGWDPFTEMRYPKQHAHEIFKCLLLRLTIM